MPCPCETDSVQSHLQLQRMNMNLIVFQDIWNGYIGKLGLVHEKRQDMCDRVGNFSMLMATNLEFVRFF